MKKIPVMFQWLLVAFTLLATVAAHAVPASFSTTDELPPPEGVYVTPTLWHAAYANGIIIRDVRHRGFTNSVPPPALGLTQVHTFDSTVDFQLSTDNGLTYSPASGNAMVTVQVTHTHDTGTRRFFKTEMLSMDLVGGGIQLRESPIFPSRGRTSIRPVAGGFMVDSFFDIFTEVSLDGGATWTPAQQAAHVEFRPDAHINPVPTPTPVLPPPNDEYVSPQQYHALYAQGIVIEDVRHKFFTPPQPPPPPGTSQIHQFDSMLDMRLSTDGGNTFQFVSVPAKVEVRVSNIGSSGQDGLYDTEMLALDLVAPGIMLRESPTEPSRGTVNIQSAPDGSYRIDSFFDIWTEVSLDGGASWNPATNGPVRVVLEDPDPPQPAPDPNLPPLNGEYISPQMWHALYENGIIISNVSHNRFTQSQPPPAPGTTSIHSFDSSLDFVLIQPGLPAVQVNGAQAAVTVQLTSTGDSGDTRYFDTEMLQLDISGGGLPADILIRESPTLPSDGRLSLRSLPGGDFQVDSFFDIWTEVSIDGGNTWSPATVPGRMGLATPPTTPLNITCPGDFTVPATGPAGAIVNYTVTVGGGCDPTGVSLNCTPPPGSLFPVGSTRVNCVATDLCGNTAVCSFVVTVDPPLVPPVEIFFPDPVLPPPGVYISPQLYHVLYANGIVIRDVRHRGFTHRRPVPPLGGTVVETFDSTVDFQLSTDNGANFQPASGDARVTVKVTHTHDQGNTEFFQTEMLSMQLTAGGGALLLRESPTESSQGQTSLRGVPGGFAVDSFFDIWTEVSLDGGGSWMPSQGPAHVELRPDPANVPPIQVPANLLPPPNDVYVSPSEWHALFAQGIVIRDVKHKFFTQYMPPPPPGGQQTHQFNSVIAFELSLDGGASFQPVIATAPVQVHMSHIGGDGPEALLFDTEISGLNFQLPPQLGGIMVRESQSEVSRGLTEVKPNADGTFQVDSFFDIWTEVSLDGGNTWLQSETGPGRMQLEQQAPEQHAPNDLLPPPDGEYISPQMWHALYENGIIISNVSHRGFTNSLPPPQVGQTVIHTFDSFVDMDVILPGDPPFHVSAPALAQVRVSGLFDDDNGTRYFDTEMLSLDIQMPGMDIRESPEIPSLGRTSMRPNASGFHVSSFFDIWTEVSLDGGATWSPSLNGPATVHYHDPLVPPVIIGCPSDMVVLPTSAAGAVVNFVVLTGGGCEDPILPTLTCTPPSGSVFPVGTTTVTCVAQDSCGNTATCSFNVTVKPYVRPRFFPTRDLPPPNGQYVSPADWHALYANGVIISNASHRRFLQSSPPPDPGTTNVHSFGSELSFEVDLGDGTFQKVQGFADVTVQVGRSGDISSGPEEYSTEILSLDLVSSSPIQLRESPTLPSPGEVHIRTAPGGFMVDSFFDIWTEVSLNGGTDWSPASSPTHVELQIDPASMPTILTNPRLPGGNPTFSLETQIGVIYLIQRASSVVDPEWFTTGGLMGDGQSNDSTDQLGEGNMLLYRAKVEEPPDTQDGGGGITEPF